LESLYTTKMVSFVLSTWQSNASHGQSPRDRNNRVSNEIETDENKSQFFKHTETLITARTVVQRDSKIGKTAIKTIVVLTV